MRTFYGGNSQQICPECDWKGKEETLAELVRQTALKAMEKEANENP